MDAIGGISVAYKACLSQKLHNLLRIVTWRKDAGGGEILALLADVFSPRLASKIDIHRIIEEKGLIVYPPFYTLIDLSQKSRLCSLNACRYVGNTFR